MKKLLFSLAAMIAMVATSCVQADVEDINLSGNEGVVTFVVKTDALGSRTGDDKINDGKEATALSYGIYDSAWNLIKTGTATMEGLATTLELRLVKNKTYNFAFWAQNSGVSCYTLDFENKTLTVDYDGLTANNDDYDAFYGTKNITVNGTVNAEVTLKRPFAQINFATADTDEAVTAGYNVPAAKTSFTATAYKTMSLIDGGVSDLTTTSFTFTAETNPTEQLELKDGTKYDWLAMNYILVGEDETSLGACSMTVELEGQQPITIDYPMAPAKRNWRTNLVGNLLTEAAVIKVEIAPVPEGEYTSADAFVSQLAAGGKITLMSDIVLTNQPAGFVVSKDTEIDLNGYTLSLPDVAAADRKNLFEVEDPASLTLKNGTIVIESTNHILNGTGTSTGGSKVVNFVSTGDLVVENVTIYGSKRGGHRAIDVYGGTATISNSTINCYYGSGVNACNEGTKVEVNNCDITVEGMYSAPYNSVCFSAMYGGEVVVNGGSYKLINNNTYSTGDTHGGWVGIVMNSGGTFTINDGSFENVPTAGFNPAYERAIFELENNKPAVSTLVLAGGKYKPQSSKIYAGYGDAYYPTYVGVDKLVGPDAEGWWTLNNAEGYVVNGDEYLVSTGAGFVAAVAAAPANAKISLTTDIDLTGVDFTPRSFSSLVFNGNNNTISGVKIENQAQAALFGKTWVFDIQNVTIANSSFSANNIDGEDAAAAFIAFLQTYSPNSKIVNCHVENCTIGSAKYVGGLVAYKDGSYPIALEGCSVKNSTLISKYTEDNGANYKGHCGGLVGYFCGDSATSTIVNCVVEGNTFDVLGPRCGLFIGTAQANYAVSGKVENNNGLTALCGAINNITDWSNVSIVAQASTDAELNDAIANNATIVLSEGTYVLPTKAQGKTLTFVGSGDPANTVIATNTGGSYEGCNYALDGSTVVFKNISITTDNKTYTGYARCKATFVNCIINNSITLYGDTVFEGCTLNVSGDQYNVWTWAARYVTFNNCVFNSDGKALLLYGETATTDLTVNGCTFNETGVLPDLKAAIEIGCAYGFSIFNVVVNDTVVNGYDITDKGINTGTALWGNKNSIGQDRLNVVVDGVDVY